MNRTFGGFLGPLRLVLSSTKNEAPLREFLLLLYLYVIMLSCRKLRYGELWRSGLFCVGKLARLLVRSVDANKGDGWIRTIVYTFDVECIIK